MNQASKTKYSGEPSSAKITKTLIKYIGQIARGCGAKFKIEVKRSFLERPFSKRKLIDSPNFYLGPHMFILNIHLP